MKSLDKAFLRIVNLINNSRDLSDDTLIGNIVSTIKEAGFTGVRFYEIITVRPTIEQLLVLSHSHGDTVKTSRFTIPLPNTTLAQNGGDMKHAVVDLNDKPRGPLTPKWIADLSLQNKAWIDVPIWANEQLVALLACDWPKGSSAPQGQDVFWLEAIASSFSPIFDSFRASRYASEFLSNISTLSEPDTIHTVLSEYLAKLRNSLGAAICAVFEFDLKTGLLTKIVEDCAPRYQVNLTNFKEEYSLDQNYLTPSAFHDIKSRYVPHFGTLTNEISADYKYLINEGSFERHTALLGEISSILYYRVVGEGSRFLFRLINKEETSQVGFTLREKYKLDALGAVVSQQINAAAIKQRLDSLQALALAAGASGKDISKKLATVLNCVREEGLLGFVVYTVKKGSSNLFHYHIQGLAKCFDEEKQRPTLEIDKFLAGRFAERADSLVSITEALERYQESDTLKRLKHCGSTLSFIFYFKVDDLDGLVIYPLNLGSERWKGRYKELFEVQSVKRTLKSFVHVIAAMIENAESREEAIGALQFFEHIGHEVSSPAINVISNAIQGLQIALEHIPIDDKLARREVISLAKEAESEAAHLATVMELARVLANQNQGKVQMHFESTDIPALLDRSVDLIEREKEALYNPTDSRRYSRIVVSKGTKGIGAAIVDRIAIEKIFINLLRNAIKYSLPPGNRAEIEIQVVGLRQQKFWQIEVTNWGLGIEPGEMEKIFQPFYRGSVHDTRKAIGGTGLGLYLCRRLAAAHKGEVSCKKSVATLKDFERIAKKEGYETTFVLRIPFAEKEGIYVYEWK